MSGYGDVKTRRLLAFLKWLQNHKGVEIRSGGNHQTVVTVINTGEAYPLSTSHRTINKNVVKGFMEFLVKNEACTKEDFDSRI